MDSTNLQCTLCFPTLLTRIFLSIWTTLLSPISELLSFSGPAASQLHDIFSFMASLRLRIEGQTFRDPQNREVTLRGINVAADAKFPASPDLPTHLQDRFFEGDDVSFVGKPFSLDDASTHFSRLKRWGYNLIRYIFTWEAIEHAGPGRYDEEWLQHTIDVLRLAKEYGFYIFMDPHQDVWSRFSGGSGAPLWTLYAVGLNPRNFASTEAAWVHNTYPEPEKYPKMIWATNYTRLACQVLFTLFFAGKDFAPKAIIDGKNIQDYLQEHFVAACKVLASRIHEDSDLENSVVIGWESMNEPNRGLVGWQDLTVIPGEQRLQKGTSPTAWQAILTGSGRACEVDTWDFGGLGPYKSGTQLVDPKGDSAWLPTDHKDTKYGWHRDPGWKLGECIWAQHGVWDPLNDELLKKNYFANHPTTHKPLNYEAFTNTYFMDYYRRHRDAIRSVHAEAILFCQPPVLEVPPSLRGTRDDDPNMVFAPHFYDGVTLMMKKWNRYWNVDVFGILRGKYISPAFAIKIGETAIRNCFRDQLAAIRDEGVATLGSHPCIFTEIGIPYDMDDKYAYETGDYSSQVSAMDANHFALEASGVNGYTLWVYMTANNHKWGDLWNGEDLSIFSLDDAQLPLSVSSLSNGLKSAKTSNFSLDITSPNFSQSQVTQTNPISPSNLSRALSTSPISSAPSDPPAELASKPGFRAAAAFIRPSPIYTAGTLQSTGFDLRNGRFTLSLIHKSSPATNSAENNTFPTEIFLPQYHFPSEEIDIEVSSGKWTISFENGVEGDSGAAGFQILRWWHGSGKQNLSVKGVRRQVASTVTEGAEGYLAQCSQATQCGVM